MPDQAFDPNAPLVAEDGLEYESCVDYLCSKPVDCARNDVIRALRDHGRVKADGPEAFGNWIAAQYYYQNRDGVGRVATDDLQASSAWPFPQLWDRHAPGFPNHTRPGQSTSDPARDGGAGAGAPALATVREAGEPEVLSRVGA